MAQRLAAMAVRIESEFRLHFGKPGAQQRHVLDRGGERLAGPQAGMDADGGDPAIFANRNDDEIERDPAVNRGAAIGLGDERHRPALFEIANGAHAAAFVGGLTRQAEDAERFARLPDRPFDMIAEQGHRPIGEPAQQGRACFIALDQFGIVAHPLLHRRPVVDRGANVGQHRLKLGEQFGAGARIDAIDLDIHDRFAAALIGADPFDRHQAMFLVTIDADDGMEQAVDDQAARGDGGGDRIDRKAFVIDDADAHPPVAQLRARGSRRTSVFPADGARRILDEEGGRAAFSALNPSSSPAGRRRKVRFRGFQAALVSGILRYHAVGAHNIPEPLRGVQAPAIARIDRRHGAARRA